jgi:hypothetical protein
MLKKPKYKEYGENAYKDRISFFSFFTAFRMTAFLPENFSQMLHYVQHGSLWEY